MGVYLNSTKPYLLFQKDCSARYFVDKTNILKELVSAITPMGDDDAEEDAGGNIKYICITRPRRFGKTMTANMISSYFGKNIDSGAFFQNRNVSSFPWYRKHLNRHNVIHIMFNETPNECRTYAQYISRIQKRLLGDLIREFPNARIEKDDSLWDAFNNIIEYGNGEKFIFVLDEWDFIFHKDDISQKDKTSYIGFLSNLLKDQPYVELAYMTGILPISKYSSGSELNMFCEYTMVTEEKYSEYFGFTEAEVDVLYAKFLTYEKESAKISREALRLWYDGYHTKSGERVYNPRSVVMALANNNLGNYWTSSGPYDEIFFYIKNNTDAVRDDLALLASGTPVPAKVREYAAVSMNLTTKNEIFSAMVVYGFLNYEDGCVSIPNKELMDEFAHMLQKEPSLGYVYNLAKESERMLMATKAGDTETMAEILEYAHNSESPLLSYNNEAELTMIVNLVYLSARDSYRIEREDKAGIGYADFIFYPLKPNDDCIILELKVDHTAEEALQQIKDRNYALKFQGKIGEISPYTGRILAVGIAYDSGRKTGQEKGRKHTCKIEILR